MALGKLLEPDAVLEQEADLYAPMIGSWSIVSTWYDPEGDARSGRGEWHFDRILGGLGVQDVLFSEDAPAREYGTSVRTYDAVEKVWRIVWMQPQAREFVVLEGRREGGEIVQRGKAVGDSGRLQRWRFIAARRRRAGVEARGRRRATPSEGRKTPAAYAVGTPRGARGASRSFATRSRNRRARPARET